MYRSQIEAYFQENQDLILSHIQRLVRIPSVAKPELAAPGAPFGPECRRAVEEAAAIARLIHRYGLSQEQAAEKLGRSQSAVANKLRLLRLTEPVREGLRKAGLTERHARSLLRLSDEAAQLAALEHIAARGLNVAQTESYIEHLLEQAEPVPPAKSPTYIIKDVRLFLNSIDRGLQMMRQGGVAADVGRRDTDSEILLTIRIPKQRTAS